jgi:sugar lactone lactonase YvrE
MNAPEITVLCDHVDELGESPVWSPDDNRIWWVDIAGGAIRRLDLSDGSLASFAMPFPPGALALAPDGAPVVAGGTGWSRIDPDTGRPSPIAEIAGAPEGMRMNDGAVDLQGRFWAGTMSLAPERPRIGTLYRLDAGGPVAVVEGLGTQNGVAVSPDGRTFYLADSHPDVCAIWAFDLDAATGALANRRLFHRPSHGRPDGAAMDAEGCYWFAAIDAGRIVRVDPQGREIGHVVLPVSRPTNLAFYGPALDMLCVTSMILGLDAGQRAAQPLAGMLIALDPGVRGLAQPRATALPAARDGAGNSNMKLDTNGGEP